MGPDAAGPKGDNRFNSLTGMRAMAALAVAIHHSVAVWPSLYVLSVIGRWGYLGVDFFFCLSGFVMQWAWSRGSSGRQFLVKRFARIYPLIIVCLLLSVAAWWLIHSPLAGYVGSPGSIILNAFVVQSWFFNDSGIRQSWDGVTWSLSCEFFFYACSPLLLARIQALSGRRSLSLMILVFAMIGGIQIITVPHAGLTAQNVWYFFPPARLPEFVIGALACRLYISGYRPKIRNVPLTFAITVLLPLVIFANAVPSSVRYLSFSSLVVLPGFAATILVAAGVDSRRRQRRRLASSAPLVWLGDVSFSYYMVHALVLGGLAIALTDAGVVIKSTWAGTSVIAGFLVLALLTAWVAWRAVERPGQRMLLRLLGGSNSPSRKTRPFEPPMSFDDIPP